MHLNHQFRPGQAIFLAFVLSASFRPRHDLDLGYTSLGQKSAPLTILIVTHTYSETYRVTYDVFSPTYMHMSYIMYINYLYGTSSMEHNF